VPTATLAERVQSYSREVFEIASSVEAEWARLAQAQCEDYSKRAQALVDDVVKSAPTGSDAAIDAWKSAMAATNTVVDSLRKGYQQAAQVVESNLAAATAATSKGSRRSAGHEQAGATAQQ
jgi:hypothetical protein